MNLKQRKEAIAEMLRAGKPELANVLAGVATAANEVTYHDMGRLHGKNVMVQIASRGNVTFARMTGKISVEKGSFAFEVVKSGSVIAFPYRAPESAKRKDNLIILEDKGVFWTIQER